jgi:rhamnose utilization protein RhaD (predicted bifunctional aldolase and dehydrogenase)
MAETISNNNVTQIIGGTFSNRENADKAIQAFRDLGVPEQNLQVVVQLNDRQANEAYTDSLKSRGIAQSQAVFYDKAIREGKTLVAVQNVTDPKAIIDVFDRYGAEYNPDGSRNLRDDVAGMTAGVVIGAAALGAAGAVVAGPLGAAVGVAAGTVIGGGAGAAAGKAAEHRK